QLAEILKSTCREMDWAIRLGGEEFLIVSRVNTTDQLLGLAERFRLNVESHSFDVAAQAPLKMTCSIGVCMFPFIDRDFYAVSWERTISLADEALYMAKNEGRNRWVALFGDSIKATASVASATTDEFQKLINRGEVVAVRSSSPLGRETLRPTG
ncbi:MAG: GGDEF domain-containing protein, partial [Pseudomonadota bacterium]